MRIAYYAPLKSPDHPVPSGDRLMAGMLRAALCDLGHMVTLVSELRSYCGAPDDHTRAQAIEVAALTERRRISDNWQSDAPDLWISYHPYYKSPDLIGPSLCRAFSLPYVTIETSYSNRRNLGVWAASQATVLDGITQAAANICLTTRDRAGIAAAAPGARLADLPPFIDTTSYLGAMAGGGGGPVRLIAVAMMRAGDKLASYALLAKSLIRLAALDWQLTIVGAGPIEAEVRALFAGLSGRIVWAGLCGPAQVATLLRQSDLYLWPGFGEAYGLAYLEAQAAGLPVVAQDVAGVPEVVGSGSGLLTPPGDDVAYADAVASLIGDAGLRTRMGLAARARVLARHSLAAATERLGGILVDVMEAQR